MDGRWSGGRWIGLKFSGDVQEECRTGVTRRRFLGHGEGERRAEIAGLGRVVGTRGRVEG